jgi:hypothetical protein
MTLQNLLATGRLQLQTVEPSAVRKLLAAAHRNLADAQVDAIGADNRFDAAYKCVLQCAMLGLWAHGYRTSTSQPGHHQTAIQCLSLSMGIPSATVIVLDRLRKQRNIIDYMGEPVSTSVLAACLDEAERLLMHTESWLLEHRPDIRG